MTATATTTTTMTTITIIIIIHHLRIQRCWWRRLGVWEQVGFEMAFESQQGMTRSNV